MDKKYLYWGGGGVAAILGFLYLRGKTSNSSGDNSNQTANDGTIAATSPAMIFSPGSVSSGGDNTGSALPADYSSLVNPPTVSGIDQILGGAVTAKATETTNTSDNSLLAQIISQIGAGASTTISHTTTGTSVVTTPAAGNVLPISAIAPGAKQMVTTISSQQSADFAAMDSRTSSIVDLYHSILGREPDLKGLEYWRQSTMPIDQLRQTFITAKNDAIAGKVFN